ncbi:MAG: DNA-binding protein with domain [Mycobacterium sp.]|jgi:hypothetical protein|nr:DNA-binding protein with domain [Mycobacterium sp.]
MIVIVDPDLEPEPPASLLRRLYGLTKSEAEIALMVLRGQGHREQHGCDESPGQDGSPG